MLGLNDQYRVTVAQPARCEHINCVVTNTLMVLYEL